MKSRTISKFGHVGSKNRSLGQILEKPLEAIFSVPQSWSLVRMFVLIKSQTLMKIGLFGCKLGH